MALHYSTVCKLSNKSCTKVRFVMSCMKMLQVSKFLVTTLYLLATFLTHTVAVNNHQVHIWAKSMLSMELSTFQLFMRKLCGCDAPYTCTSRAVYGNSSTEFALSGK